MKRRGARVLTEGKHIRETLSMKIRWRSCCILLIVIALGCVERGSARSCNADFSSFEQDERFSRDLFYDVGEMHYFLNVDLNNDSYEDILMLYKGRVPRVYLNSHDGLFQDAGGILPWTGDDTVPDWFETSAVVHDFDGDGFPEILLLTWATPDILLRTTDGLSWDFVLPPLFEENETICEEACGSRANNSRCEDGEEGSVSLLCAPGTDCADCGPRRRRHGSLMPFVYDITLSSQGHAIDYDGDGKMDILVQKTSSTGQLYKNLGNFSFAEVDPPISTENDTVCIDACEAANDGTCSDGADFLSSLPVICHYGHDCTDCSSRPVDGAGLSFLRLMWSASAVFDANGDGRTDIFIVPREPNIFESDPLVLRPRLYLNRGNGTFEDVIPVTDVVLPLNDTCEFAGDGVCQDDGPDSISALCVYGTDSTDCGLRSEIDVAKIPFASTQPQIRSAIHVRDLDNNGFPDLFICTEFPQQNFIFWNEDGSSFTKAEGFRLVEDSQECLSAAVGDMDSDGLPDVYVALSVPIGRGELHKNTGRRSFEVVGRSPIVEPETKIGITPVGGIIRDIDHDGAVDFVLLKRFDPATSAFAFHDTYHGYSVSSLVPLPATLVDPDEVRERLDVRLGATVGDLDQNGYLDYVFASSVVSGRPLYVLYGQPSGRYIIGKDNLFADKTGMIEDVSLGDCNGDGYLDLATASHTDNDEICINTNGRFASCFPLPGSQSPFMWSRGVEWGDVDNDGDVDLLVTSWNSTNRLYKNDGNCSFTMYDQGGLVSVRYAWHTAAFGDYDNDGCIDVAVSTIDERSLLPFTLVDTIYYNTDCNGTFELVAVTANHDQTTALYWVDTALDGFPELVRVLDTPSLQNAVVIHKNDAGNPGDIAAVTMLPPIKGLFADIVPCDVNSDGYPDLILPSDANSPVVLLNVPKGNHRPSDPFMFDRMFISLTDDDFLGFCDQSDDSIPSILSVRGFAATCGTLPNNNKLIRMLDSADPFFDREYLVCKDGAECTNCPPGTSGQMGRCEPCRPGTTQAGWGSSECTPCQSGRNYNEGLGQVECSVCPPGTHVEQTGAYSSALCSPCPEGTARSQTARINGSCPCEANAYRLTSFGRCYTCPNGATCENETLSINAGYWAPNIASEGVADVYSCPFRDACLGGTRSDCRAGHEGVLCASCDGDRFLFGRECRTCFSTWAAVLLLLLLLAFICVVVAFAVAKAVDQDDDDDSSNNSVRTIEDEKGAKLGRMYTFLLHGGLAVLYFIEYLQLYIALIFNASILALSESFVDVLLWLSLTNLNIYQIAGIQCFGDVLGLDSPYADSVLIVYIVSFVILCVAFIITYFRSVWKEDWKERCLRVWFFVRIPVLSRAFEVAYSDRIYVSGQCWYGESFNVKCDSSAESVLITLSTVWILVHAAVFVYSLLCVTSTRQRIDDGTLELRDAIALTIVAVDNSPGAYILLTVVIFLALVGRTLLWYFSKEETDAETKEGRYLEVLTTVSIILSLLISAWAAYEIELDPATDRTVIATGIIYTVFTVSIIGTSIILLLAYNRRKKNGGDRAPTQGHGSGKNRVSPFQGVAP